jgi:protocatechuate 3,4-dioxygenase beta subunit
MSPKTALALWAALLAAAPPATAAVTGRVTAEGKPVVGATVSVYAFEAPDTRSLRVVAGGERMPALATRSAADGSFRLDVPDAEALVGVYAPGFAPLHVAAAQDEPLLLALTAAPPKRGTVTAGGKPVAGAVMVWMGAAVGPQWTEWITRTGADGGYEVPDPDRWATRVAIVHPDFAPLFPSPTPKWAARHVLTPGSPVTGKVTERATGRGVGGATVWIDAWPRGRTGADGSFTIPHAEAEWDRLDARTPALAGSADRKPGPIAVQADPVRRVSGVVREAATRRPLAGATVTLVGVDDGPTAVGVTDARGQYALVGVPAGSYWPYATLKGYTADAPADQGEKLDLRRERSAQRDFELSPQRRLTGRVTDEQGRPVDAAMVTLGLEGMGTFYGLLDAFGGGAELGARGHSAPDGTFSMETTPFVDDAARRANLRMTLVALKAGYAAGYVRLPAAGTGAVIVLRRGAPLRGRVTGPGGEPLADVPVAVAETGPLFAAQSLAAMELPAWTRSDAEGRFSVQVNPVPHLLSFRKPGHAPRTVDVADPASAGEITVVLDPAAALSGRVVRADGRGLAAASLSLQDFGTPPAAVAGGVTDEEGRFTLADLAAGAYELKIAHDDGISATRQVQAPAADLRVELAPSGTVRGRVVDAATRAPVAAFQVHLTRQPRPGRAADDFADGRSEEIEAADGTFVVEGLPPGAATLYVRAEGYRMRTIENVAVTGDADAPAIDVALEPGVAIKGRVTADGAALADAQVSGGVQGGHEDSGATSDENGDYELKGLPAGEVTLRVSKQGYQSARRTVDARPGTRVDIALSRGLTLSGVVVADEAGVAKARVGAYSGTLDADAQSATTDDAGRFTLTGLSPGRYTVTASAEGKGQARLEDVDIATAGQVRLVIDRQNRAVLTGTVVGAGGGGEGQPSIVVVYVNDSEGRTAYAMADASGAFRIEDAPAGHVTAVAAEMAGPVRRSTPPRELTLAPGSETATVLEFKEDAVITGTVTRAGAPVPNASVDFRIASGVQGASAPTDREGRYRIGLAAGEYRVHVAGERVSFQTELVVKESASFDIDVTGGGLRGRVVDAATQAPLPDVEVSLWLAGKSDTPAHTATTTAEGAFEALELREGSYRLLTSRKGYGQQVREIEVARGGSVDVRLELQPAEGVTVTVTDARDGRPLSAIVVVRDADRRIVANRHSGADDKGAVTIPLADGPYLLSTSATGYGTATQPVASPSRGLSIGLTPGGTLIVESAEPITGKIRLLQPDGEEYVRCWCNGIAEITLSGRRTEVENITPGAYTLELVGVPGRADRKPVVIQEGQRATVTLD